MWTGKGRRWNWEMKKWDYHKRKKGRCDEERGKKWKR
jgi:hypothetical protein